MSVRKVFTDALKQRILVLDGAMGTMIQALKLDEEGYRGARFDAWNREVRGNNDLLNLSRPEAVRDIHLAYFRAGADIVSTNTFSSTKIAQADYGMEDIAYELNHAGATLAREAAAACGKRRRPPPLRGRCAGADQPHGLDFAGREQSRLPRHQLRPIARGLWRADQRPDRRRRRSAADRDHLRHAQRQGRDLRHCRSLRRARHRYPGDDLRHHHRPLRAFAVGTDAGGVLEFGKTRQSGDNWAQLRARRARDARPYRRARPPRRYFRVRLSERRAAERIRLLRRKPGIHGRALGRVRRSGAGQRGRRLLRHHARSHRGDCQSCGRQGAARDPRSAAAIAAVGAGSLHADAGNPLREYRRAHQRHRLGQVPQADHRRRLRQRLEHRARAGGERRAGDRRQHGRRAARTRKRRW